MDADIETRTMRKVARRVGLILAALYFVSYIDRTNIAFASLTMNEELGFSPTVFGLGGSLFFVGYLALQIPGTVAISRFGGRTIMMAMALAWGLLAMSMAFIWNPASFYVVRILLGAAESAFFPGAIFYISLWFPPAHRARMTTLLLIANPVALAAGFPLSAALMGLDGVLGFSGWQWIFLVEGVPAVILAFVAFWGLSDRPDTATWLTDDERRWLNGALGSDQPSHGRHTLGDALSGIANPVAIALSIGYCGIIMGIYGLNLWAPQIIHRFGFAEEHMGLASAIPYVLASTAMLIYALRFSNKGSMGSKAAVAALAAGAALVACGFSTSPIGALIALSVAAVALYIALPAYWSLPTLIFPGVAGAGVVGLVSMVGHVGGVIGPVLVGYLREVSGDFAFGLCGLAASLVVTAGVAWAVRTRAAA